VQKAWKALHFVMRVIKQGNRNTKRFAYTSFGHPVIEYGAACWDHVRKISDRKQRTDIGKYSFVNRNIKNWNELSAEALGTFDLERELGKQL